MSNDNIESINKFELAKNIILAATSLRLFGCLFYQLNIQLIDAPPFFTAMAYYSKNLNEKTGRIGIVISKQFISTLNNANEVVYVLLHEIMHILNKHMTRSISLDPEVYNIACDHVINTTLDKDIQNNSLRGVKSPESRTIVNILIGKNLSAEEVYKYLMEHAQVSKENVTFSFNPEEESPNDGEGTGEGTSTKEKEGEGTSTKEKEGEGTSTKEKEGKGTPSKNQITFELKKTTITMDDGQTFTFYNDITPSEGANNEEKNIQDLARRLLSSPLFDNVKNKGNSSSNTMELIKEALKVEVPWNDLLEKVIKTHITERSDNKTWRRVNKRMYNYNILLPHYDDEETYDTILIIIDTSGSISSEDLKKFVYIIKTAMYHFKKVIKIDHDAIAYIDDIKIYDRSNIDNLLTDINMEFVGRGGTSHKEIYNYIEKIYNGEVDTPLPGLILFITDFYSDVQHIHHKYEWVKDLPYKYILTTEHALIETNIDNSPIIIK